MAKYGLEHHRATVSFEDIEQMRFLYFQMKVRPRNIIKRYGVTPAAFNNWIQYRSRLEK